MSLRAADALRWPGIRTFRSPRFRLVVSACLLVLTLIAMVQLVVVSIPGWLTGATFHDVMAAGRIFWAGQQSYGPMPIAPPDKVLTGPHSILYPPTNFLLLWPVIALPSRLQVTAWLSLYMVAVPVIFVAVYSTLGRPTRAEAMLAVALFLASYPVRVGVENGEVELLVAALIALTMVAFLRGHPGIGGFVLAGAILLKPTVAVLLLAFFLWKRAGRLVAAAVSIAGAVVVATLAFGWLPRWLAYAALMGPVGRGSAFTINQGVNGFVLRLLSPASSGQPIAALPLGTELAVDFMRLAFLVLLGWLLAGNRLEGAEREWTDASLALLGLPLLLPYTLAEHWTAGLVVIPVALRLANLGRLPVPAFVGLAVAWLAMMGSNFVLFYIAHNVTGPSMSSHPLALLFASSLLYAVILGLLALGLGVRAPRYQLAAVTRVGQDPTYLAGLPAQ